jgi:hypothetical protein
MKEAIMLERREIVGGGVLTALMALLLPKPAAAREQRGGGDDEARSIATAVDKLREAIEQQGNACNLGPCVAVAQIRQQLNTFIKANRKFPDYLDAGVDAWQAVYDWHVKNRQTVNATRLPEGRYGIAFMFTTVVLREDQTPNFVGWGYDAR